MAARPVALYDANVLYPAQLRDFLMRLAVHGVVRAQWTKAIHDEWMRNVHANFPDIAWGALERTQRLMDEALPDALVEGYEHHTEKAIGRMSVVTANQLPMTYARTRGAL